MNCGGGYEQLVSRFIREAACRVTGFQDFAIENNKSS
jgi:hypothetical protein